MSINIGIIDAQGTVPNCPILARISPQKIETAERGAAKVGRAGSGNRPSAYKNSARLDQAYLGDSRCKAHQTDYPFDYPFLTIFDG